MSYSFLTKIICKDTDNKEKPGDTNVSVKLFDEPEVSFTVPGEIPWTDPKFSEVVAQEALDRYKQTTVWVFKKWFWKILPLRLSSCVILIVTLITASFLITGWQSKSQRRLQHEPKLPVEELPQQASQKYS